MREEDIKNIVGEGYARIARQGGQCCGGGCSATDLGRRIGYTEVELSVVPEGANLGLGCGNPVALASLKEGLYGK